VRQAYDLDLLRAADFDGVLQWVIRQGAEWFYGPVLGPAFADAVLANWAVISPQGPDYWA
jgi:hypothetical protein